MMESSEKKIRWSILTADEQQYIFITAANGQVLMPAHSNPSSDKDYSPSPPTTKPLGCSPVEEGVPAIFAR
jgi:hypothetical protein